MWNCCLVRICKPAHTTHDTENIVVDCINADFAGTSGTSVGKLEGGVINTGEVATSGRLVFQRADDPQV